MKDGMHFQIKLLFAVLICVSTCFSQARQRPQVPAQTRTGAPFLQQVKAYEESDYVTKIVLKNGMTVLVNEFRGQSVVSVQLSVHAGFLDDPPQTPGVAQLVASLAQRGGTDKTGGTFRQNVQALGGILRSTTGYGTTVFEVAAPSNQWKRALNAQSDSILNASFDETAVKLEAKLLRNESRGNLDDPGVFPEEKLLELAFSQPRMANSQILAGNALEKIPQEVLTNFYKKNYAPANMMLVISGDVGSSEVLNEVARIYAKLTGSGAKPASPSVNSAQDEFRYAAVRANVSLPHLYFGFHAVPENDEDYAALEVLSAVLGSGESAVIPFRLRDQLKAILSSETSLAGYPEFGYLSILLKANPADIDRSEIALLTELELLKREDLIDAELARAVTQVERSYWSRQETVSGKAQTLARFELLGDWKRMDQHIAKLRKIKSADVKRVASKYLRIENCSLLEYLPASMPERNLNSDGVRNTFEALLKASTEQVRAERNKETVLALKFPAGTANFKYSEIQYPFQTASILRGPNLFIREDHATPLLEMGLFFPGGRLEEKKENAGITKLMLSLILRGSADVRQTYRQLELYGGQVRPVVTDDYFGIYLSVLSPDFEPCFSLLTDMIKEPNFDKEVVQRQKELQTADILVRRNSNAFPRILLDQALFGSFPYSLDGSGTEASVSAISPDSLAAWYDTHVKNRKPLVAVIGDTKGTSLATVFVKSFSGSRMQENKLPEEFAKALDKGESAEQTWDRSESLILVGFQAPPEDDEDRYAVSVLRSYLGDPGKLSQELRDRLGLASEVLASYEPRLRGGSFVIRAATAPEDEEDALKELRSAIQKVNAGPIPYREFRSAMNEAAGAYTISQQVHFAQIGELAEQVLAGKGLDGYLGHAAGLQDVKEEDLQAIARRILNMDRAVVLRLHGKK